MNTCETCKWYKQPKHKEDGDGECKNSEVKKLLWAENADGIAAVYIYPNFGCVNWEAKEEEV